MNQFLRNIVLWGMIALLVVGLFTLFQGTGRPTGQEIGYSEFITAINGGQVSEVRIDGRAIEGLYIDGRRFTTISPGDGTLVERLEDAGVRFRAAPDEGGMSFLVNVLISWFPMLLLIGVWIFFMRQMQSGGGRAMGFGRSRARMLTEKSERMTFKDVAGIDEAKAELEEIVEYLRDPAKFRRLGGRIPKGVLLVGPPGTGKTLTARAVAGEANVPFFTISGSDFVEMFVGVGASRVRDMFEQGKKHAPCIIFIDEIDAVGRHRGAGLGGGNDEREQTLNQLLVEMDGFESTEGVILIAATNRPDVLDPALLRPGRFDRQVVVPNPDILGREQILKVHMRKVAVADDIDPRVIARGTPGFSGADLANLVNEAALLAARSNAKRVGQTHFEMAKDKVMMGSERRSMVMTDDEKSLTAWHEAGHAVVALHEPESDPIHKATIIPRGRALGMVMRLPETDRLSMRRDKCYADLAVAMGGRIAEEMIFGKEKISSGASSDIKMVTELATRMVTEWGMSKDLGMLLYGTPEQEVFLGHSVTQHKNISDATAQKVDAEIRHIVDTAYERAQTTLTKHKKQLKLVAEALLEFETLSGDDIRDLIKGKKIVRDEPIDPPPPAKPKATDSSVPSVGDLGNKPQPS
ncbi:MAG: ATP-dependent zinc metalloprotease FtsH [Pseudomonadota bacterium]